MRSNLTISIDHDLKLQFKEYCYQTRQPQGVVIENLISEMFEKKKEYRSPPGSIETGNATVKEAM